MAKFEDGDRVEVIDGSLSILDISNHYKGTIGTIIGEEEMGSYRVYANEKIYWQYEGSLKLIKPPMEPIPSECRTFWEKFPGVGYETTDRAIIEWIAKPWYVRLFTSPRPKKED